MDLDVVLDDAFGGPADSEAAVLVIVPKTLADAAGAPVGSVRALCDEFDIARLGPVFAISRPDAEEILLALIDSGEIGGPDLADDDEDDDDDDDHEGEP